jgi:UDP:flavonoid glycosyltransferase YjiC (YdhE family)
VQECLATGRPMVVIPFGGDQVSNAHRVERLGVGLRMSATALSADTVRTAVETLSEARFVERAREIARALETYGGTPAAADAVLGFP